MQSQRFAPPAVADRYPYPVEGTAAWQRTADGFRAEVPLERLEVDEIVVPSFALLGAAPYGFRFALESATERWLLAPIAMTERNDASTGDAVSTHIDYFHVRRALDAATLIVEVAAEEVPSTPHLLAVARRQHTRVADAGSLVACRLPVPPVSQLTAPRAIRHRICSTTCVNMVLSYYGVPTHNGELTSLTHHVPSQMFGVWPLNMWAASRKGALGAVELFASLDDAVPALTAGLPVVSSIRFRSGELVGAPLDATGGHLVVLTGLTSDSALVNDPAGRGIPGVLRSYRREQFAAAWLTERGAAYVMLPPD
jgi:hypothetical protein